MDLEFEKVRHKNKYYVVINVGYKDIDLPVVTDWQDFRIINDLGKSWKCNKMGFISCNHIYNKVPKEVFIHEIIMALKQKAAGKKKLNIPIVHINRIGLDNRRNNLIYDTSMKDSNKNIKKKKRTLQLPANSGIELDEIPTYVWYMKPNGSHGDRFMVEISDINWKTTSSKKLSLRYKLEEAKKFLRELKKAQPHIFDEYSMNGDFTKEGKELIDSYYTIVHKAGYNHINRYIPKNNTDTLLRPGSQSRKEKKLLRKQNGFKMDKKRRVFNNIPDNIGITSSDLPKYVYYRPEYKTRGDYFVVENHPQQDCKIWQTTSSNKIPLQEKYRQLIAYYNSLEN